MGRGDGANPGYGRIEVIWADVPGEPYPRPGLRVLPPVASDLVNGKMDQVEQQAGAQWRELAQGIARRVDISVQLNV